MGKLKKGHVYFRFTRWRSAFQSDLSGVLQSRTQEAREVWSVAPGTGGADIFHPSFLLWLSLASLQIYPCFANMVFVTESVQKLTTNPHRFLTQESSKNNVLRMGWGLKEMSERQLALKSPDTIGSRGLDFLLIQNVRAPQTVQGLTAELSQPPRDQKWAASRDLSPLLLAKTCCGSLYCLNVLKLTWLSVCRVINELIGNLVGHLYFFLMFRYPMDLGGRNFLSTPQFL